jgi:hypothetical protein
MNGLMRYIFVYDCMLLTYIHTYIHTYIYTYIYLLVTWIKVYISHIGNTTLIRKPKKKE